MGGSPLSAGKHRTGHPRVKDRVLCTGSSLADHACDFQYSVLQHAQQWVCQIVWIHSALKKATLLAQGCPQHMMYDLRRLSRFLLPRLSSLHAQCMLASLSSPCLGYDLQSGVLRPLTRLPSWTFGILSCPDKELPPLTSI